jgi:hypothetical protein
MRFPRTTQERRATGKRNKWGRARRNAVNLPTARDDFWISYQKSWKTKRKTQYNPDGRGSKYSFYLEAQKPHWRADYKNLRAIERFFENLNVVCRIDDDKQTYYDITVQLYRMEVVEIIPVFYEGTKDVHYYHRVWDNVLLKNPIYTFHKREIIKGYKVTYWTNKNIDLRYLHLE